MSIINENNNPEIAEKGHVIEYVGTVGGLVPIVILNLFFTIITIGIYRFWAKTNIRKYLWSKTRFDGEAFEYIGTGGELFVGAIMIGFLLTPFFIGFSYLSMLYPLIAPYFVLVLYPLIMFLVGVAVYRAQVYRMSRTRWRRLRYAQLPRSMVFGLMTIKYIILYLITFGLITPYLICKMWNFIMNNKRFGSGIFYCDVKSKPLFKVWALSWLAAFIVLGGIFFAISDAVLTNNTTVILIGYVIAFIALAVIFAWFKAALFSHLFSGVRFETLQFDFKIDPIEYLKFSVINTLIIIFTLGLGSAFVTQRWVRLICDKLTIEGYVKFVEIVNSPERGPMFGEGLAEAFDIG